MATGVTGKMRKCLAEQAMPYQSLVGVPPMLSVRTSAIGHGRGERSGPRPWDTSPQAIDAPHLASPRSSAQLPTTTEKAKKSPFFAVFGRLRGAGPAEAVPDVRGAVGGAQRVHGPLIAQ